VFDLDGTLTDTCAVDDECYRRAIGAVLQIDSIGIDWTTAPDMTDSGIADWVFSVHQGALPSSAELDRFMEQFLAELRAEYLRSPARFQPIAGAIGVFEHLRAAGWQVAIATGGWERSARFKLEVAGLADSTVPMASASDATSRTDIMRLALERATARHGIYFDHVVAVGDAPWDARAATELQWPLVTITRGGFGIHGVHEEVHLGHLMDRDALDRALAAAVVPRADAEAIVKMRD
jgi:phosphoglycolate phosphatase-like HAD superfamily hydrolase